MTDRRLEGDYSHKENHLNEMSVVDIRPLYDWQRGISVIKKRSNVEFTRAITFSGISSFP